jgi:hypothetical protein
MVKQATGICTVNSVLVKRGTKSSPDCPQCGEFETSQHIFQCQQVEKTQVWEKSISTLWIWMESVNTSPNLIRAICTGLGTWRQGVLPVQQDNQDKAIQAAIGWGVFLEGGLYLVATRTDVLF